MREFLKLSGVMPNLFATGGVNGRFHLAAQVGSIGKEGAELGSIVADGDGARQNGRFR